MKIMTCSDLHLRTRLYSELAAAVAAHRPDVLCLVGDFLDCGERRRDTLTASEAALFLASLPCECVFVRGNHESDQSWLDFEDAWTGKKFYALHGSAVCVGGIYIVGFPCWMGCDEWYARGRKLDNYHIDAWLTPLLRETGPAGRALWLAHEPCCLELSEGWLSTPEWADAIRQYQPLVFVSGHDHRTPLKTGIWNVRIGDSVAMNLGQRVYPTPGPLLFATIEFSFGPGGMPRLEKIERHG